MEVARTQRLRSRTTFAVLPTVLRWKTSCLCKLLWVYASSCKFMRFHANLCEFMRVYAISCKLIEFEFLKLATLKFVPCWSESSCFFSSWAVVRRTEKKSTRLICFQWTTDTWAMNQSYARADFLLSFLSSLLPWNLWKLMIFGSNSVFVCAWYDVMEVHLNQIHLTCDPMILKIEFNTLRALLHRITCYILSKVFSLVVFIACDRQKNSLKRSDFSSRNWRDWLSDEIN